MVQRRRLSENVDGPWKTDDEQREIRITLSSLCPGELERNIHNTMYNNLLLPNKPPVCGIHEYFIYRHYQYRYYILTIRSDILYRTFSIQIMFHDKRECLEIIFTLNFIMFCFSTYTVYILGFILYDFCCYLIVMFDSSISNGCAITIYGDNNFPSLKYYSGLTNVIQLSENRIHKHSFRKR